jgi:hypothetical protein
MLSELHRMLGRSPAGKLGFVLTAAAEEGGYGYGNSYGYGYGYAAHEETPRQAEGVV